MDEEGSRLEMEEFSISDAILDTAEPFGALADSRGKKLSIDVEQNVSYRGNEGTLRQLVSLLLDNAIKYSPADGTIALTFYRHGKNLHLTVSNTTDALPPGRHDEFFERFYRHDASRNQKSGGHGIGLSVAYAIVTAHKGKISARSHDGHSLTISVTL
jgi:signal transduction histidine kinase